MTTASTPYQNHLFKHLRCMAHVKPFTAIAKPNPDVLSGPSNLAKYAADLHAVATGGGGREYSDPDTFHRITHYTPSMRVILSDLEDKIQNGRGDAFKHIETPFGGGKTHNDLCVAQGQRVGSLPGGHSRDSDVA